MIGDDFLKTASPDFFSNIGMFVILVLLIFRDKIFSFKLFNSRKEDRGNWFEKFIATTESHTRATLASSKEFAESVRESSDRSSEEIRNLANVISRMSEAIDRRAEKAIGQHEYILKEIDRLDVPRKR